VGISVSLVLHGRVTLDVWSLSQLLDIREPKNSWLQALTSSGSRKGGICPGQHCAGAAFGKEKYGILKVYTPQLSVLLSTLMLSF